jgi:CheY-like chemotaxis protein
MIDDDSDDIGVFREALDAFGLVYTLQPFRDWETASAYLESVTDTPDVIVLDLNMPRTHGHEALAFLKANVKLRHIPVIVLSVSRSVEDNEKSRLLGADGFFSKPQREEHWHVIVKAIVAVVHQNQPDKVA